MRTVPTRRVVSCASGIPQAAEGDGAQLEFRLGARAARRTGSRHHAPGDHRGDGRAGGARHAAAQHGHGVRGGDGAPHPRHRLGVAGPVARTGAECVAHLGRAVQGAHRQYNGLQGGRQAGGAKTEPEGVSHGGHPVGHRVQAGDRGDVAHARQHAGQHARAHAPHYHNHHRVGAAGNAVPAAADGGGYLGHGLDRGRELGGRVDAVQ